MTDPTPSTEDLYAALVARTRELETLLERERHHVETMATTWEPKGISAEREAALRAEVARLRDDLAHEQRCAAARSQPVEPHLSTTLTADNATLRARLASTEAERDALRVSRADLTASHSAALVARAEAKAELEGERAYRVQQTTAWADERAAMKAERDEARRERDEARQLRRLASDEADEQEQAADGLASALDRARRLETEVRTERDAALAKLADVSEVVGVMLNVEQQPIRIAEVPRLRERLAAALSRAPSTALAERDARVRAEALGEAADELDCGDVYVEAGRGWPVETNGHIAAWLRSLASRGGGA